MYEWYGFLLGTVMALCWPYALVLALGLFGPGANHVDLCSGLQPGPPAEARSSPQTAGSSNPVEQPCPQGSSIGPTITSAARGRAFLHQAVSTLAIVCIVGTLLARSAQDDWVRAASRRH